MKKLKQVSEENLTEKLNFCKTADYFQDPTGERRQRDIEKYTSLLEFVKAQPEEYFNIISNLANITKTYYCCGGHSKAAANETEKKREAERLPVEIPDDAVLLSFGEFNGEGAV